MEDPSYTNRANEVRRKFGDDYSIPYADMFIAYNMDPSLLPNVQLMDDLTKAGTMGRTADGKFIYRREKELLPGLPKKNPFNKTAGMSALRKAASG